MIESIVILFLLVYIAVKEYLTQQERKRLIDAYLAKNLTELKQAEAIEKMKVEPEGKDEMPPDFIPLEEASDEQFGEAIQAELGHEESVIKKLKRRLKNG